MRVIVVGLGVQGIKRRRVAGTDCIATIDPVNPDADYRRLDEISFDHFDAALVCTPDGAKAELLETLLGAGKHVLVEKPLTLPSGEDFDRLSALAAATGAVCVTAYNHRFEPHFVRMRDLIASGDLGHLYHCRMFYGNGTARLVRDSVWRDQGSGVLDDLGSHLLDTIDFWFGQEARAFEMIARSCFENNAPDHAIIVSRHGRPSLELEMMLLSWRNHFTCDVFAEKGSAHIQSLCKWGPSSFTHRRRVLPSGRPPEVTVTLVEDDPTWAAEYQHFKGLCAARKPLPLARDRAIQDILRGLAATSDGKA